MSISIPQVLPQKAPEDGCRGQSSSPLTHEEKLHQAWTEFLSAQPWQWFVTFTFKEEIHPEAADKLFRVWVSKINRYLFGKRWREKKHGGIKWCRALEWQKRGVLHYHALVANTGYLERKTATYIWEKLGKSSKAGFIKIDQYEESLGGAEGYLSKYVTKGGQVDLSINFNGNIQIPDYDKHEQQILRLAT